MAHVDTASYPMDSAGHNTRSSPLGLEFGEFMMDGDFLALLNR
jgi:hypothetical protein